MPRKKTEPQYYEMIKSPIDMLKIQQKIKTDVYNELEEFCKDVQLLVDNAKLYYAKVRYSAELISVSGSYYLSMAVPFSFCIYIPFYFAVFHIKCFNALGNEHELLFEYLFYIVNNVLITVCAELL